MCFSLIAITLRLDLGKERASEMPTWNLLTLQVNRENVRGSSQPKRSLLALGNPFCN